MNFFGNVNNKSDSIIKPFYTQAEKEFFAQKKRAEIKFLRRNFIPETKANLYWAKQLSYEFLLNPELVLKELTIKHKNKSTVLGRTFDALLFFSSKFKNVFVGQQRLAEHAGSISPKYISNELGVLKEMGILRTSRYIHNEKFLSPNLYKINPLFFHPMFLRFLSAFFPSANKLLQRNVAIANEDSQAFKSKASYIRPRGENIIQTENVLSRETKIKSLKEQWFKVFVFPEKRISFFRSFEKFLKEIDSLGLTPEELSGWFA